MDTVVSRFEAQVTRTPDKIALQHNHEAVSYGELNQRANQLAHYLRVLGIQSEQLVGLCLPRSVDLMVGLLGILKAGAAYVPLDPDYPEKRLADMLEDSQLTCVLLTAETHQTLSRFTPTTTYRSVDLKRDSTQIWQQSTDNLSLAISATHLAYCLYTSGSTGLPKAVLMEHASLANLINWHLGHRVTPARQLQFSPIGFDISAQEIFATWCSGGCLFLIDEELRRNPMTLLEFIGLHQIEKLYLPFTPLQQLAVAASDSGKYPVSVVEVITAGEPLQITPAIKALFQHTQASLHHHYGATECQDVTALSLTGAPDTWPLLPSVGKAIENIQTYILDETGQQVAAGEIGRLFIGGCGIARGYLHRPELTKQKFISNPFGAGRLYDTSDSARYLPSGDIELLGRTDNAIKIRGFRVELGEIEAVLSQHEAVTKAVVVLLEKESHPRLAAYVTLATTSPPELAERPTSILRAWLKTRLPDYMIPASVTVLEQLPLTPNGKINRQALPAPTDSHRSLVLPRTPLEEMIADLWREVFKLQQVSVEDDFFELGGNSLTAFQLLTKIQQTFQVELSLQTLLNDGHTVATLATLLATRQPTQTVLPVVAATASLHSPLSAGQQALWFIYQQAPQSPAYNMALPLEFQGEFNQTALLTALQHLVQRHPALRTTIALVDNQPRQTVHLTGDYTFTLQDARGWDDHTLWQELDCAYRQPFELSQGPGLRANLYRCSPQRHLLLLTMHHLFSDGRSLGILLEELLALYTGERQGRPVELPPLLTTYADYVRWEDDLLNSTEGTRLATYWQTQLAGEIPVLQLPTDYPRPPVQTFHGAVAPFTVSAPLSQQLKTLAQTAKTTLFTVLLTAFQILLHRYTGQPDLWVGTPMAAGRRPPEFANLIGYLVNPVVLRVHLESAPDPSFQQVLANTWQTVLAAVDHQAYPFPVLVKQLQPQRDLSHAPLCQVMFNFENAQLIPAVPGVKVLEMYQLDGQFDLSLNLIEGEVLAGAFVYNPDLFDAATIQRWIGHFHTLLAGLVKNPAQAISQLPLLTEAETQQLLAWNQTQTDYPTDQTIVDLFQAQVAKTPENIAVVFEGQQLTYQELNAKANQLAHYLMTLGVTAETLVGICVERSLEMVIGLLGILKAGGAYVPLDPEYPQERLQFMLEDSQVPVLLAQQPLQQKLSFLKKLSFSVVHLDSDWKRIATGSEANPVRQSEPAKLAYVIYTSGSTGRPKGVMIEHRALTNFCLDMQHRLSLTAQDKLLALTTLSFDIAGLELYLPLLSGAQTVVLDRETARHGDALANRLAQAQITVMQATPATWQLLVQTGWTPPTSLTVLCGGEALPRTLGQTLLTQGGHFWNVYGPTETTIWSTSHNVTQYPDVPTLLGKPIANTQIYILDTHYQPQPLGIPGELCIAGAGLARGYLNRPDLSAEKFLEIDLFGQPTRVYRTGDLARWLPDGNLEYLGRLDHQVKLRGFRIELGEIEATLTQHEVVKEAVVVLREQDTNPQLAAYVTVITSLDDAEKLSFLKTLSFWLKTRLPDYMIPASFTVLEKLPLTPNGKVDRQALPAPDWKPATAQIVPRTETERLLLNLWSQVLGVEITSIQTNFFEAGGHSLLATQLVSRIRDIFQVEMPLRVLFEQPQLQAQAHWLDTQQRHLELPPLLPVAAGSPPVLSFAQQRLWFLAQLEGATATYNIPAALRLVGPLNESALQRAVATLVERHDSLHLCFPRVDGQATVQRLANYNPWSVTDWRHLPASEAARQVRPWLDQQATTPFDLSQGPLFRCQLLQLSDTEHVLLFNLHHIISDGWSIGILFREWNLLYQAYRQGQESPLPALPIQYTDYAAWQRQWLAGEVLEQQLAYWRNHLAGAPALLELPTDLPRPAVTRYQGALLTSTLDAELTRRLTQFSRQQGVTLFMTLLAAFQVLLSRYSGQSDIVVGSPIANRTHSHTEDLIGLFVNTLVLRTQVQGDLTFLQLLKAVRETALGAYSHQDLPFEYLVEQLQPPRSLSYSPLFQVMFVLQNTPPVNFELGDLQGSWVDPASTMAKFDLTLSIDHLGETLRCDWEYRTELFRPATIQRLTEHFQVLLTSLLQTPELAVAHLPLLTDAETQQLLAWNQTQVDYPTDQTIIDLFQAQVEKTPANIAVVFEDQQLTYQELNAKANQLAHYLMTLGVTAETLVGICVERSLEMVIGLLGILKAGGAYVPLDPAYPSERLQFMLEDSQVPVLLTQQPLQQKLSFLKKLSFSNVNLDSDWERIAIHPRANPLSTLHSPLSTNLAYVIYTSGSTGRPKGVLISHQGLCNLAQAQIRAFGVQAGDRVLQFASLNFDASISELVMTLLSGATLYLAKPAELLPGAELSQFLVKQAITHVTLVPSALATLAADELKTLTTVIVAGEACPLELAQRWRVGRRFFNAYGPTETTVCATILEITQLSPSLTTVPIGRPIENLQVYLLDSWKQPVPIGVTGELYVGGAGLARGYLNRPDLTAERFLEVELFGQRTRVYRTGDLARWLPDGNLEYLGRLDHQIKLRGFRIELGEIEATLTQHEEVKEAVVVLREQDTHPNLAAYVTLLTSNLTGRKEPSGLTTLLRVWLKTRLPDYMVPASITVLEKLPLNPNGKIDRQALPSPEETVVPRTEANLLPQTTAEHTIATIWQQVLRVTNVGIHSNFFDLGGHSLLLLRVQAQLQNQFAQPIALTDLFEYPTIQSLAQHLTTSSVEGVVSPDTQADRRQRQETTRLQRRTLRQQHRSNF